MIVTPGSHPTLMGIGEISGRVPWVDAPAVADGERQIANVNHVLGGSVLVVEAADGSTAIVRGGPSTKGAMPWR